MNAKEELLEILKTHNKTIKCAKIEYGEYYNDKHIILLRVNYTHNDLETFLQSLDFDYYDGYGGQELYGIVWLDNDTWLERGEYDGSEWWDFKTLPIIPSDLY